MIELYQKIKKRLKNVKVEYNDGRIFIKFNYNHYLVVKPSKYYLEDGSNMNVCLLKIDDKTYDEHDDYQFHIFMCSDVTTIAKEYRRLKNIKNADPNPFFTL